MAKVSSVIKLSTTICCTNLIIVWVMLKNWWKFSGAVLSLVRLIPVCLTQWWSDEGRNIWLHREISPHTLCRYECHGGGSVSWQVACNHICGNGDKLYFATELYFPLCPAHHFFLVTKPGLPMIRYIWHVWHVKWITIKIHLHQHSACLDQHHGVWNHWSTWNIF